MFDAHYTEWNSKRAKAIIDYYGHKFFYHKRILDLGAGDGSIGMALSRLGAEVHCVDVRQENIKAIQKKYPHLQTKLIDLDNDFSINEKFDIVLSMGLLCHLKNYERHLEYICNLAEHVVLETEVLDSLDNDIRIPIFEDRVITDLSFHGEGSIVSSNNIQSRLNTIGVKYKRKDETKLNTSQYKYDWLEHNSGVRKFGNRRLWFIRRDKILVQAQAIQQRIRQNEINLGIQGPKTFHHAPFSDTNTQNPIVAPKTTSNRTALCISVNDGYVMENWPIIENPCSFDIFIHTFNEECKNDLLKKFMPIKISTSSDNIDDPISKKLYGISSAIQLKEEYELEFNKTYETVIVKDILDIVPLKNYKGIMSEVNVIGDDFIYTDSITSNTIGLIYDYFDSYLEYGCEKDFNKLLEFHIKYFDLKEIKQII
jgi:hypothetical protein